MHACSTEASRCISSFGKTMMVCPKRVGMSGKAHGKHAIFLRRHWARHGRKAMTFARWSRLFVIRSLAVALSWSLSMNFASTLALPYLCAGPASVVANKHPS